MPEQQPGYWYQEFCPIFSDSNRLLVTRHYPNSERDEWQVYPQKKFALNGIKKIS